MSDSTKPRHTNRLAGETSPYLLQHAHNPVDWYPWGPEALDRARSEDKPILLSIGYAACHWCHVMERESFENDAIARSMNESFVSIKVDREERPDLDDIYMAATVAMSGSGGWPMTVFLTPDQRPFFAGTYFPPVDKYGRPGFPTLLQKIASLWKADRESLTRQAEELTEHVRIQSQATRPKSVSAETIAAAARQLAAGFDEKWGGFSGAPKFPPSASLSLLLRHHRRSGDERSLRMATVTLDAMKNGGIYDQIGGGFARYSTDERWLAPHFEKMLYDNAQLARVYLEAYQVTKDDEYRRVAAETLDYVVREMQGPEGGYYSATDADSEGEEGKFFVWSPDEIEEVLGAADAERFSAYYDVTPEGNWEGKSILNTPRPLGEVARELGVSEDELIDSLRSAREKLYMARLRRVPPLLDDKVLVSWNGLMIGAMAEGHRVLREPRYRDSAERAARFVLERMRRPDRGLHRTSRAGHAHLDAYLEDYAYFSDALVDLYEAGAPASLLAEARSLARRLVDDFGDEDGGPLFFTAKNHETLLVRTREGHDGAIPNANAVAARALARLSFHYADETLRAQAERAIEGYGRSIERQPRAFATTLAVLDLLLEGPLELVFAGTEASVEPLVAEVAKHYLPNRIIGHLESSSEHGALPLLTGKTTVQGRAGLYVCRNFTCKAPVTDVGEVAHAIEQGAAEALGERASALAKNLLAGHATSEGTARYAKRYATRHGPGGYVSLGKTGLCVSRLGFGGYRIDDVHPEHRAALAKALREGCNLIDTSTNYGDGKSEEMIGEVVAELFAKRELSRDELVVVSKIGYVQGQNLEIAEAREQSGKPFPEMVKYGDGIWHSMHPEWLEDQLGRSLARLGLERLDFCLIHNPEYFFSDAVKRGRGPLVELRDEFYARLTRAFAHFEREVERGRISFYGVSSNTSTASRDSREAIELARMLAAAREAAGDAHHFRILQLPMNLIESEAAFEKNNGEETVLEHARRNDVGVLVNRPLNAILGDGLLRLADPPELGDAPPFETALGQVAGLEQDFRRELAPMIRTRQGGPPAETLFAWSEQLASLPARIASFEQYSEIEAHAILPRVSQLLQVLDGAFGDDDKWAGWRDRYLPALDSLLSSLRKRAADRSAARARMLHAAVDELLPEERRQHSLSRKALWALVSAPAASVVLVGMREPRYVDDALAVLGWPLLENAERVFTAVRLANVVGRL